jgi:hypothetical protein
MKYKFDLVALKDVRWDEDGNEPADDFTFSYGMLIII